MIDKQARVNELLKLFSLDSFSEQESLNILFDLVDYSFDLQDRKGTNHAIELLRKVDFEKKFPAQRFLAHYVFSVALSDLRGDKVHTSEAWDWDQPDLEMEIVNVRLAARYFDRTKDDPKHLCNILSNLGGTMAWMGRYVMSQYYWNIVQAIDSNFGNAVGSAGDNMIYQSFNTLYTEGYQEIFYVMGYRNLAKAVKLPLEPGAKEHYQKRLESIERSNPQVRNVKLDLDKGEEFTSPQDEAYRTWSLENCLFLNPINDLGDYGIATYDSLELPAMSVTTEEGGAYHSFFNQIKQEYVSARFILFDSLNRTEKHFSDEWVMKYDLLDSTQLSLATEMKKISFRMAYSIFDKVAFFLNFYLKLKIPETKVNFRTLWFDKQQPANGLRPEFKQLPNLSFRALYWLGKDIHVRSEAYRSSLDPTTFDLATIRNFIEHKNFRIFNDQFNSPPKYLEDDISYSIYEKSFDNKNLRLLQLAREAIIYMCLGINREEANRNEQHS